MKSLGLTLALLSGASMLQAQQQSAVTGDAAPELSITPVDRGAKQIEEQSVLLSGLANSGGTRANGMKVYKFTLMPGETLVVQMKAEGDALSMTCLEPSPANAMTPSVRRANIPPKAARSRKMRVVNPTKEEQEAVIMVGGQVNHAYVLTIQYEPGS